ncbi:hypothetical protein QUF80_07205 [Desulfococcaceae bacterium HSG8]|nr:hypothetical protein [Desulfococcaceae bacterium HSG8]
MISVLAVCMAQIGKSEPCPPDLAIRREHRGITGRNEDQGPEYPELAGRPECEIRHPDGGSEFVLSQPAEC